MSRLSGKDGMRGIVEARVTTPAIPWFGIAFVGACTTLIFFGFSFTFVSEVLFRVRPFVLYVHVATAASFMILVVVQAALAMRRKLALHRRIGEFGFYLGATAAVSAFASSLVLRHDDVMSHSADQRVARIAFLSVPLNGVIAFSILLACTYFWRHKSAVHRRCILLAAAVLTLPAVARIPVIGTAHGIWSFVPTDGLILLLCGIDLWRDRRLHPVYRIGVPGVFGLQGLTMWLFLAQPDWWVRTAAFLCGV